MTERHIISQDTISPSKLRHFSVTSTLFFLFFCLVLGYEAVFVPRVYVLVSSFLFLKESYLHIPQMNVVMKNSLLKFLQLVVAQVPSNQKTAMKITDCSATNLNGAIWEFWDNLGTSLSWNELTLFMTSLMMLVQREWFPLEQTVFIGWELHLNFSSYWMVVSRALYSIGSWKYNTLVWVHSLKVANQSTYRKSSLWLTLRHMRGLVNFDEWARLVIGSHVAWDNRDFKI